MFAVRIERDRRVIGVVMVAARLMELQLLLDPHGSLPEDSLLTVTDANGIILARSIDPGKWIGSKLTRRGIEAGGKKGGDGFQLGKSADGVERIAGYAAADAVPWEVYVGVPTNVALHSVRIRLNERLFFGGAMFVIGLVVALKIGQRIVTPIRQLAADAAAFEHGDLLHRTTASRIDEIDVQPPPSTGWPKRFNYKIAS
jgi:methyl-accepting chemotaxis protein